MIGDDLHALCVNLEPVHCDLLHALELELESFDFVCKILCNVFVVGCHEEGDCVVRCGSVHELDAPLIGQVQEVDVCFGIRFMRITHSGSPSCSPRGSRSSPRAASDNQQQSGAPCDASTRAC